MFPKNIYLVILLRWVGACRQYQDHCISFLNNRFGDLVGGNFPLTRNNLWNKIDLDAMKRIKELQSKVTDAPPIFISKLHILKSIRVSKFQRFSLHCLFPRRRHFFSFVRYSYKGSWGSRPRPFFQKAEKIAF